MSEASAEHEFVLVVPLDASGIEGFSPEQQVKVLVTDCGRTSVSVVADLNSDGHGQAILRLPESPAGARIHLGPSGVADEDLPGLQTMTVSLSSRLLPEAKGQVVRLEPIRIPSFYWYQWLRWCRRFTVRGRLLCPDGSPVPGATVCAYDVDWWWWWCTDQQVGCATTDVHGAFEITFTWCCGWWPWWWWARRLWRVEPGLAEKITAALGAGTDIVLPPPQPRPTLDMFDTVLARDGVATAMPTEAVDPARLDSLRARLLERLPAVAELERLRVWPWLPWHPWWDCSPDLIFRATQSCDGQERMVLDESCLSARPDVPTTLNVTLVANDSACCAHRPPCGCGDAECLVISHACGDLMATIGGNVGASPMPAGYRSPGVVSTAGDRPYAGTVALHGVCGDWMDYYEFEWSDNAGLSWHVMPAGAAGGFTLTYYDLPTQSWNPVSFAFTTISGRLVVESRAHYEATHSPGSWGVTRVWVGTTDLLMNWVTAVPSAPTGPTALFGDGTYRLRVRAWDFVGGDLENPRIPPLCGSDEENRVVLTLDNRMVGPGAGHPTTASHPCGPATVHLCTAEPDTQIIDVRLGGEPATPCSIIRAHDGTTVDIEFLANDPDGHLAYYTLHALYGNNGVVDLLAAPSATLTRVAAAQVGPTYGDARAGATAQNIPAAVAPVWNGGRMRLTIANLRDAFPQSCCYLLELRAWKRTIDSCDGSFSQGNYSVFTFTVEL
ncbi:MULTISPECIES: hypothetical protein [unclassified Frankia]|uniref:hypothetical protein n=1 Tax=unclassified Frankia TaxID=2632575 RepID=UPI002AD3AC14|nr:MULTISPECIES: hypothetical protein [unclassified Frankia]